MLEYIREDLKIDGVVRMARKTLVTLGKDAGLTNKQMKYISHHDQEKTIDIHYDKGMIPEIMKNEGIVAKIYKFPKKNQLNVIYLLYGNRKKRKPKLMPFVNVMIGSMGGKE